MTLYSEDENCEVEISLTFGTSFVAGRTLMMSPVVLKYIDIDLQLFWQACQHLFDVAIHINSQGIPPSFGIAEIQVRFYPQTALEIRFERPNLFLQFGAFFLHGPLALLYVAAHKALVALVSLPPGPYRRGHQASSRSGWPNYPA